MKRIFSAVRELIFPSLCVICSEPSGGDALCADCLAKYAREREQKCPRCNREAALCECGNALPGIICSTFYTHYGQDSARVTETLLYILKTKRCDKLCEFFAREVSVQLMHYILKCGRSASDYTLTYIPRSCDALERYGFDHAEKVAARISRLTGIKLEKYLKRCGGTEQKKLSAEGRFENARQSLLAEPGKAPAGKRIILFDDIVTTGAGLSRGSEILLGAGALEVVPAVIARTRSCRY